MSWKPEVDELHRREALAKRMGGEERVARQREAGRLTVRERIEQLADRDSFHETGALTGVPVYEGDRLVDIRPSNFVAGTARLDGRRVVLGGDDFTVRGGAADGTVGYKAGYAERMALELRLPIVRLVDGTGGGGSVKSLETTRRSY
ncbi:MAG TPA: carboxyl transferase domain-containing protein, partial [Myxococcota bacterium]|nr:carboxyl transferase domain-containing protein [Myxococcota bacterium]